MDNEMKKMQKDLEKFLYNNKMQNEKDKEDLKQLLFPLLREAIKEQIYVLEIGPYTLEIDYNNLAVRYETDETTVELSGEDVYYETTRELEIRYFAVDEEKTFYEMDSNIIVVSGLITNVCGFCEESYQIDLYTKQVDDVRNYLNLAGTDFINSDLGEKNPYSTIIKRPIKKEMPRLDILNLFGNNNVIPVVYNEARNIYVKEPRRNRIFNPNNYSLYLPDLDDKKELVYQIYSITLDFYNNL